ncbi:MAG: LPS assembly protein LptD [Planctomycetota bacterium]
MLKKYKIFIFLIVLGLLGIVSSDAEEKKSPETSKDETKLAAYIRFQRTGKVWKENGFEFISLEQVELYQAERVITADSFIGWKKEQKSEEASAPGNSEKQLIYEEVYAEGNVKVTIGQDQITADQVYFNFKNDTGIIINAKIKTVYTDEKGQTKPESIPVIIKAKTIYQINKSTLIAKNTSVSTCTHGKPHYEFFVKRTWFISDEKNKRLIFHHIFPMVQGIPFFYWPYYRKVIGNDPFVRSIKFEKTKRFGNTVQIVAGLNLNKYKRDETGHILKDKYDQPVTQQWGDLEIKTTYFQKRGTAWEPELDYDWKNYHGFLKGYYIKDKGPDTDIAYDRQFIPLEKSERNRVKTFHRHYLNEQFRLDTETSWLSDRHLLLEFFEKEAKEGKEQESYVYLRHLNQNRGGTLLERARLNNFQTQTEYLPQATYQIINEPLHLLGPARPVYFSGSLQTDNLRKQYDEQLNQDASQIWRTDFLTEFSWPYQLGFIKTMPFASWRWSTYEKGTIEDKTINRTVTSGGLRFFTQFYRVFDIQNKTLGINQLSHIISFDARQTDNFQASTPSAELLQFDSLDRINRFTENYFEIRNRFKTTINDSPWQFLDFGLALEYYPRAERDTVSENYNNYLSPMNWITLSPDNNWVFSKRRVSNLHLDLSFTPNQPFSLGLNSEYNTYEKNLEIFNGSVNLQPYAGWSIGLTERYIKHSTNALGVSVSCTPIEKWQFIASEQYDFKEKRLINRAYVFRRDLHELFLEFSVQVDRGKDEKTFYLTLIPKGIGPKTITTSF